MTFSSAKAKQQDGMVNDPLIHQLDSASATVVVCLPYVLVVVVQCSHFDSASSNQQESETKTIQRQTSHHSCQQSLLPKPRRFQTRLANGSLGFQQWQLGIPQWQLGIPQEGSLSNKPSFFPQPIASGNIGVILAGQDFRVF